MDRYTGSLFLYLPVLAKVLDIGYEKVFVE